MTENKDKDIKDKMREHIPALAAALSALTKEIDNNLNFTTLIQTSTQILKQPEEKIEKDVLEQKEPDSILSYIWAEVEKLKFINKKLNTTVHALHDVIG